MKRLTILGLHLGYGGIENAIASFANNMCQYYDITIVVVYKLYNKPIYSLDSRIHVVYLINDNIAIRVDRYKKLFRSRHFMELNRVLWDDYISKGHFIKLVKDTLKSMKVVKEKTTLMSNYITNMDTDIVISTRMELNTLVSRHAKDSIYKIAWEHNHGDDIYISNIISSARNMNMIVVVSNNLYNLYTKEIKQEHSNLKCTYVPNVIDFVPGKLSTLNTNNLITVGRLAQEKGYLDLIDVFNIIHHKNKTATLTIIGDGDQRTKIVSKIKQEHLDKYITLVGYKDKNYINKTLLNSSIFLMTSYTESFGIVLVEAFACGVPAISFTSAEGANELIVDNKNGYLIKDRNKNEMAQKTLELLKDTKTLKEMGKEAYHTSLSYTADKVYDNWKNILK